jgi:hypothetical protein
LRLSSLFGRAMPVSDSMPLMSDHSIITTRRSLFK